MADVAVATPSETSFPGGALTGLAINSAFTQGSLQDFSYRFEGCGTEPAEATCNWQVRLTLGSNLATRCVSSTPDSQLLWDSGERSGNGAVALGPFSFALEGCRGQVLVAYYEFRKTYNPDEQERPWKLLSTGGAGSLFTIGIGAESIEEVNQKIIAANPGSQLAPPTPRPGLAVGADCRSLRIGSTRYVFFFRRMGCHKATNLATMAHTSDGAPNGYRCRDMSAGGIRCWRQGQPKKLFGWQLPRR